MRWRGRGPAEVALRRLEIAQQVFHIGIGLLNLEVARLVRTKSDETAGALTRRQDREDAVEVDENFISTHTSKLVPFSHVRDSLCW